MTLGCISRRKIVQLYRCQLRGKKNCPSPSRLTVQLTVLRNSREGRRETK